MIWSRPGDRARDREREGERERDRVITDDGAAAAAVVVAVRSRVRRISNMPRTRVPPVWLRLPPPLRRCT